MILSVILLSFSVGGGQDSSSRENLKDIRTYLKISERLSTAGQITYEQIPDQQRESFIEI